MDTVVKIVLALAIVAVVIAAAAGLTSASLIASTLSSAYEAGSANGHWTPMEFAAIVPGADVLLFLSGVVVGRLFLVATTKVVLRVLSI